MAIRILFVSGEHLPLAGGRGEPASHGRRGRRAGRPRPPDHARFDLILAADPQNRADLEALRPAGNTTSVRLLAGYVEGAETDPYLTGDFDGALERVERACAGLAAQLQ